MFSVTTKVVIVVWDAIVDGIGKATGLTRVDVTTLILHLAAEGLVITTGRDLAFRHLPLVARDMIMVVTISTAALAADPRGPEVIRGISRLLKVHKAGSTTSSAAIRISRSRISYGVPGQTFLGFSLPTVDSALDEMDS